MKDKVALDLFPFAQLTGHGHLDNISSEKKGIFLARKIELGMRARDLSRQSFAQLMGVQPSIITRWLSGRHNFTIETLFEIERMLGITLFAIDLPAPYAVSFHMVVDSEYTHFSESPNLPGITGVVPVPHHYYGGGTGFANDEDDLMQNFYLAAFNSHKAADGTSK